MRDKSGLKSRIGQVVKTDSTFAGNDRQTAKVLNNFCLQVRLIPLKSFRPMLINCLTFVYQKKVFEALASL